MLSGMARSGMPAEVFNGMLQMAQETLSNREWQQLSDAIGGATLLAA